MKSLNSIAVGTNSTTKQHNNLYDCGECKVIQITALGYVLADIQQNALLSFS